MEENFNELRKKFTEAFSVHYRISDEVLNNFSQMIWENPDEALDNFGKCYNESLNKAYTDSTTGKNNRWFVDAFAGGPHEAIPSAYYNVIGSVYPIFDRKLKNKSLEKIFGIFDGMRNDYVYLSHTSYIKEPLLLSDISIARAQYWPGLEGMEGERLIKKYNNLFCDFKYEAIDEKGNFNQEIIDSDFLVAYTILRNDFCDWGDEYAKVANPKFLDRVVNGISGMRFAFYEKLKNLSAEEIKNLNREVEDENYLSKIEKKLNLKLDIKIEQGRKRLKELLPKSLHKKIDEKFNKKDWVDPFFLQSNKNYLLKYCIENLLEE